MGRYDVLLGDDSPKQSEPKPPRPRKSLDVQRVSEEITVAQPNELKDSAFFRKAAIEPVRPSGRTPVLPVQGRRTMRRHPFEIYDDQYPTLRSISLEEKIQGGLGSMSAMVREAIDAFIEKRRKK
jgi:hypothetical protein